MFWRVLYTNPRAEMKVAQRLTKIGIEAYCQARIEIRQRSDRKIKIWLSLLPSMVLVNIDEIQKYKGFEIQGVVRYLYWLGQLAKVSEEGEAVDFLKYRIFKPIEYSPLGEFDKLRLSYCR